MHLTSILLRKFATRFLADPYRASHDTSRANAAQASAAMRGRRREREGVEAYVQSLLDRGAEADSPLVIAADEPLPGPDVSQGAV